MDAVNTLTILQLRNIASLTARPRSRSQRRFSKLCSTLLFVPGLVEARRSSISTCRETLVANLNTQALPPQIAWYPLRAMQTSIPTVRFLKLVLRSPPWQSSAVSGVVLLRCIPHIPLFTHARRGDRLKNFRENDDLILTPLAHESQDHSNVSA
ncbi:hypothetical protein C8F04DRAFT_106674 [Mycena alexandri]|uniref:Uncharacterized protein n=1 Tax=Mycena alexandri TaxID=1745969 RepID=A0AAD6SGF5_9AGAR|nr:hypothetical protein C8F04DRAFT_106674 [Mycena alexandri]